MSGPPRFAIAGTRSTAPSRVQGEHLYGTIGVADSHFGQLGGKTADITGDSLLTLVEDGPYHELIADPDVHRIPGGGGSLYVESDLVDLLPIRGRDSGGGGGAQELVDQTSVGSRCLRRRGR